MTDGWTCVVFLMRAWVWREVFSLLVVFLLLQIRMFKYVQINNKVVCIIITTVKMKNEIFSTLINV